MTVYSRLERRSGQDRRQQQFSKKRLFLKGVRESTRRTEDRNRIAVFDRYEPNLFIGNIIVILSLSMIDAILTLTLISQGAKKFIR